MKPIRNIFYWSLDYLYVAKEQLLGFFSRTTPDDYHRKGATPIVLIPGIYENWRFMHPIAEMLHAEDYDVHVVDGLGYNRGTIEAMADLVVRYCIDHRLKGVAFVAHSKGGLIGKYVLAKAPKTLHAQGLVSINTPYSGSKYASFLPFKSLRIFIPHSPILDTLALATGVNRRIVSIYGIFDPHIPKGSKLEGAENIQLPVHGHFRILQSDKVHSAVIKSIISLQA